MKLFNFIFKGKTRLAILSEYGIIDVEKAAQEASIDVPTTIEEVILRGEKALLELSQLIKPNALTLKGEITYAPAVTKPEKIICVGLNYISHTSETKADIPTFPVLFSKFNNSLASHNQSISIPSSAKDGL